jgi:O-antigen ligase
MSLAGFAEPAPSARRETPPSGDSRARRWARRIILALLVAAPLAFGSVHEPAFVPLLVLSSIAGLMSLASRRRSRWREALRRIPGGVGLGAFAALILFQLVPLPPAVLSLVSPGTVLHLERFSLVPLHAWHAVSVNPADTARGLAFWVAFALLYAAVQREADHPRWRRRAMQAIVATGCLMTLTGLAQAASAHPSTIYGLWKPLCDWAVFGPYVNHNHFAGYLALATPLALGFLAEALGDLGAAWRPRGRGWLTLGDPEGTRVLRLGVVCLLLVVGLLASRSRGGLIALAIGATTFTLLLRRRRLAALAAAIALIGAVLFVDVEPTLRTFGTRGLRAARVDLWADALRAAPHFPVFGAGLNAYGTLSTDYQTTQIAEWVDQAHCEYLQVLVDTGLIGCAIVGALLFLLARAALRAAQRGPLEAGLAAALAACAIHNLAEFNWQIPANAATFVVIAGVVMRRTPSGPGSAERGSDGPRDASERPSARRPPLTVRASRI